MIFHKIYNTRNEHETIMSPVSKKKAMCTDSKLKNHQQIRTTEKQ